MSPELRIDPLSGLRVIVAGERGTSALAHAKVAQVPAPGEMELHWGAVSDWMGGLLMERGPELVPTSPMIKVSVPVGDSRGVDMGRLGSSVPL